MTDLLIASFFVSHRSVCDQKQARQKPEFVQNLASLDDFPCVHAMALMRRAVPQ
jgi:hypothetical protein